MRTINDLGNFPVNGEEARKTGNFYKVRRDDALLVVNGRKNPVLMKIFVSNDVVTMGEVVIPAGGIGPRQTELDEHPGDAVYYVSKGRLTFLLPKRGETYLIEQGEYMFIPEGNQYRIVNYETDAAEAVFTIAPEM